MCQPHEQWLVGEPTNRRLSWSPGRRRALACSTSLKPLRSRRVALEHVSEADPKSQMFDFEQDRDVPATRAVARWRAYQQEIVMKPWTAARTGL